MKRFVKKETENMFSYILSEISHIKIKSILLSAFLVFFLIGFYQSDLYTGIFSGISGLLFLLFLMIFEMESTKGIHVILFSVLSLSLFIISIPFTENLINISNILSLTVFFTSIITIAVDIFINN